MAQCLGCLVGNWGTPPNHWISPDQQELSEKMIPKGTGPIQSNKMDKYATTKQLVVIAGGVTEEPGALEPSLGAIMAAIQDVKTSLKPKLDTVTIDVNMLWANLQKMSEKVKSSG
ncbi:hypothetical protein NDU88_001454 [Pleurodeles waltl]|uniref:Uncharacterized protein n=1 Tax=Pleurodeles waltl TaxID=8319 RepID=A0AAV7U7M0_PLEWA|nr:hypothetical protein NDU88_001454 [Pleurodeles waltl]